MVRSSGVVVERWSGGVVRRWSGGVIVRWPGRVVEWLSGGEAEEKWWKSGAEVGSDGVCPTYSAPPHPSPPVSFMISL